MDGKQVSKSNISIVARNSLYTGCATCVGSVLEKCMSIHLDEKKGLFRPTIDKGLCRYCGTCMRLCPGIGIDTDLRPVLWKKLSLVS